MHESGACVACLGVSVWCVCYRKEMRVSAVAEEPQKENCGTISWMDLEREDAYKALIVVLT